MQELEVFKEVKAMAILKHQNVVAYHTCWLERTEECEEKSFSRTSTFSSSESFESVKNGEEKLHLFIQMELIKGKSLKEYLLNYTMKKPYQFFVFTQIIEGLAYIH